MFRFAPPQQVQPSGNPGQAAPAGPSPELLAAQQGDPGGADPGGPSVDPTQDPTANPSSKGTKFDIDKISQDVAGYQGPGATCSGCEFFDGQGGCQVVQGQVDPQGWCRVFTPLSTGQSDQAQPGGPDDGSDQLSQPSGSPEPGV